MIDDTRTGDSVPSEDGADAPFSFAEQETAPALTAASAAPSASPASGGTKRKPSFSAPKAKAKSLLGNVIIPDPAGNWVSLTRNEVVEYVTREVLALDAAKTAPAPQLERALIAKINWAFQERNQAKGGNVKHDGLYAPILTLTVAQIADVMLARHHVVNIKPSGKNTDPDFDLLAVYEDSGEDEGLHLTSLKNIRSIMRRYDPSITTRTADEVLAVLDERAPRVTKCTDPDVIPVQNGLFDYKTKQLNPFSPDVVITSKARVELPVNHQGTPIPPKNPVFTTPDGDQWDVESWMQDLSDDPDIVKLLWQINGAIVRPYVRWSKSAWFYSESGNNGKGTLVELMRNLVGEASYVSLPISEMGKDFALEGLTRATAILTDENDVGTFVDKAANLKALVTNDVIAINRKHRTPVNYQFWGFMVQCLNEMPRMKDRSESIYRRQLFVPFAKSFTGRERSYIKDQYMNDASVLQYVLWKVLVDLPDYYRLDEPEATKRMLDEYREFNDPVRAFWNTFESSFEWDLLPFDFLYDLFKQWYAETNPSGSVIGVTIFKRDLVPVVAGSDRFWIEDTRKKYRHANRLSEPELLIHKYKLERWSAPNSKGASPVVYSRYTPPKDAQYRGVLRRSGIPAAQAMMAGLAPEAFDDAAQLAAGLMEEHDAPQDGYAPQQGPFEDAQ